MYRSFTHCEPGFWQPPKYFTSSIYQSLLRIECHPGGDDCILRGSSNLYMGVSKNNGTPKSSILIGFSIIFTIHFGGFPLIYWKHQYQSLKGKQKPKRWIPDQRAFWRIFVGTASGMPELGTFATSFRNPRDVFRRFLVDDSMNMSFLATNMTWVGGGDNMEGMSQNESTFFWWISEFSLGFSKNSYFLLWGRGWDYF